MSLLGSLFYYSISYQEAFDSFLLYMIDSKLVLSFLGTLEEVFNIDVLMVLILIEF